MPAPDLGADPVPRSLVWATDIDALPADRVVQRRDDHLVIRSPGNPSHFWGNFLLFDEPPAHGDGERWEAAFAAAFDADPRIRHRSFAWDRADGEQGAADPELTGRGYELEPTVGLTAVPSALRDHPRARASSEIEIRALRADDDEELWEGAIAVKLANNQSSDDPLENHEPFARAHTLQLRMLFASGRGAWYAAIDRSDGAVVGGCGVVATGRRGRYQTVDVLAEHRRRGIASALVTHAGRAAGAAYGLSELVIAADPDYHALRLYESLGFEAQERVCGALLSPVGAS